MARRDEYLSYVVKGGLMEDLPTPISPEDEPLYLMGTMGFGMEKEKGFYRCKVDNSNAEGTWNYLGFSIDLGENIASNFIKVKATITVRGGGQLPKKVGLRLFANNSPEREVISGGFGTFGDNYVALGKYDDLIMPTGGATVTQDTKATIEFGFDSNTVNEKISTYRYLKPFISISKNAGEVNFIDVHDMTVEVGNVVYDVTDSIFNFMEGLQSDVKYMKCDLAPCSIVRRKLPLFGKKLACLGDSITFGYDGATTTGNAVAFPWRLALREKCGFLNVRNYGLTGRRIATDRAVGELSFIKQVDTMATDVDVITVMGGINDFAQGNLPVGTFQTAAQESGSYDITTFYGAVQELYRKLKVKYPDKLIVAINMLNGNNGATGAKGSGAKRGAELLGYATVGEGMEAYREVIRTCARAAGIPCLELQDLVSFDALDDTKKTNIPDLLHPNQAGYSEMAEIIGDFINKLA